MASVDQKELAQLLRPFVEDFEFYAPRALRIRTKSGSVEPLKLNAAQLYVHQRLEDQLREKGKIRALVLKGRQQGISTYVEGRFYWKTSLKPGLLALILTHEQSSTDALFAMTKRYHDNCPAILQPHTSAASSKELFFDVLDSGYIVATAGTKNTGRGRTIQYFHGSEAAFWPNAADHFAGLGQAVPDLPGTEVILESTANGVGNEFHQMWQDAERGKSDYIAIFVPWFWEPGYRRPLPTGFELTREEAEYCDAHDLDLQQMAWRRAKIETDFRGDVALFDQEYPATAALAFRRVTGDPLIDPQLVTAARGKDVEPRGPKIMGVDPAEYGDDDSGISFRQGRACTRTLGYSKKGPMELVGIVARLADSYEPDAINVDCTGVGSGVADRLIELGYPVNRIHFGERAIEQEQYVLRRDEMWGEMKKWFEDQPCSIPADDILDAELCAPQYSYDSSRRLRLESKEQMKKRGIKSPDRADSLALTFAVPMAANTQKLNRRNERVNWRTA